MKLNTANIRSRKIEELVSDYPFVVSYFNDNNLDIEEKKHLSLEDYFSGFDEEEIEDSAIDVENHYRQIAEFVNQMIAFLGQDEDKVQSVTILPEPINRVIRKTMKEWRSNRAKLYV